MIKTLVAGWFSFSNGHATAGDLLARDLACEWLMRAGYTYDVAVAPPFVDGIDWRAVDARQYGQVLFVCGPFAQGELETEFLAHFRHCRLLGLNLSMGIPLDEWNPFDLLIERDSSARAHPDMVFGTTRPKVPVVGVCLVEEYEGAEVEKANRAIQRLTELREMAVVPIDTRLDENSTGLRSPAEVESLIARVDVLVTTRLHGTVLALKNGVPVIAIDPEEGGAKIVRQAKTIGWPTVMSVEQLTDERLRDALNFCLSDEARTLARACAAEAAHQVHALGETFVATLQIPLAIEAKRRARLAAWQLQVQAEAQSQANAPVAQRSVLQRAWQWVTWFWANLTMLGTRQYGR